MKKLYSLVAIGAICSTVAVDLNNTNTSSASLNNASSTDKVFAQTVVTAGQGGAEGVKNMAAGQAEKKASDAIKDFLSNGSGVTEVSIQGTTGNTPTYNILLVRPLTESADKVDNTFVQASLSYQDDRTTTNVGLGYRKLVADKKVLLGTNIFYDQEFPYNHQRMSIGGEIRTTVGEINANYYQGISGWKTTDDGLDEKALGGYDIQLAVAVPYIPSAHLKAKTFKWKGVEGGTDLDGQTYSLGGAVYPGYNLETGYTSYSNSIEDQKFVKVTYNYNFGTSKSVNKPIIIDTPYELTSMEDRRFEKVQRENKIIKQVGKQIGITVTGV
mgnify:FL=1